MQLDNSNFSNIQARLETQIYNQDQEISNLKKEIQQLSKAKRDMEKKMTVEVTHCMTTYFLFIYKQSIVARI
jgi:cell division protein FtsL